MDGELFEITPPYPPPPVTYMPAWLPRAADAFAFLRNRIPWQHREFRPGTMMPRLEALLGPEGASYTYSGVQYRCARLARHPLERMVRRVNEQLGTEFNAVFVNLYRDHTDSIGWHRDDEPGLGPVDQVVIASVSLGARRRFLMRRKADDGRWIRREWRLGEGDLFLMRAGSQSDWEHSAPKEDTPAGERIAITFRRLVGFPSLPGDTR